MSTASKRSGTLGRFIQYDKSGAVSVRVREFLRSDTGKEQLKIAKELRDRSSLADKKTIRK